MFFFFFNDTATTEIYTLSLHDALPISVTGVKLDGPVHRLFRLNDDNKIVSMITYSSTTNGEIGRSFSTRTNGTIYKNHDNINTARKVIRAFENSDFDKAYSFFTDDARFSNSETPRGEALTLTEYKESIKKIRETWDVESFRSEEHTSELQSRRNIVCRLLLEKTNNEINY